MTSRTDCPRPPSVCGLFPLCKPAAFSRVWVPVGNSSATCIFCICLHVVGEHFDLAYVLFAQVATTATSTPYVNGAYGHCSQPPCQPLGSLWGRYYYGVIVTLYDTIHGGSLRTCQLIAQKHTGLGQPVITPLLAFLINLQRPVLLLFAKLP